jgi:hypothetical protein
VALFRTLQSSHNPNGVGLTISAQPEHAISVAMVVEAERLDSRGRRHYRSQASLSVAINGRPGSGQTLQLQNQSAAYHGEVTKSGYYAVIVRYSRGADDRAGQAIASWTAGGRASESAFPASQESVDGWNRFTHRDLGSIWLEAKEPVLWEIAIQTTPSFDPGCDFDTVTFVYHGTTGPAEPVRDLDPLDVNRDHLVTALDALIIINAINQYGAQRAAPQDRRDTRLDQSITPLDALLVINRLNARANGPSPTAAEGNAEGEGGLTYVTRPPWQPYPFFFLTGPLASFSSLTLDGLANRPVVSAGPSHDRITRIDGLPSTSNLVPPPPRAPSSQRIEMSVRDLDVNPWPGDLLMIPGFSMSTEPDR